MTCTVNVRMYYQPHCPDCMTEVEQAVASAIRDRSVAGISMVAQNRCAHDALAANKLLPGAKQTAKQPPHPPASATPPQGMALLPGVEASLNGFDAEGR